MHVSDGWGERAQILQGRGGRKQVHECNNERIDALMAKCRLGLVLVLSSWRSALDICRGFEGRVLCLCSRVAASGVQRWCTAVTSLEGTRGGGAKYGDTPFDRHAHYGSVQVGGC